MPLEPVVGSGVDRPPQKFNRAVGRRPPSSVLGIEAAARAAEYQIRKAAPMKVTQHLWFEKDMEAAIGFYISLVGGSSVASRFIGTGL
jgi:hypothetical protein